MPYTVAIVGGENTYIYLHTSCGASVTFGLVEAQKCTRLLKIQQLIAGAAYKAARGKTTGETMN